MGVGGEEALLEDLALLSEIGSGENNGEELEIGDGSKDDKLMMFSASWMEVVLGDSTIRGGE